MDVHIGSHIFYEDLYLSNRITTYVVPFVSAFWERGSPDLPACGLRRGSKGGLAWPIFTNTNPRPSRGAKPRGADDAELPQAQPHQAGSRGGGVPHEVPVTKAMTTKGARRVPARVVSSFPLWCKGGKHSRGVPRHQAKVAISVQQDQDQEDCKMEVIVEPKTVSPPELCAGEDYFCQDS